MTTPENKVKAAVVRVLDAYGAWYFFPLGAGYGRAGIPDIIACYKGQMYAFECKAGKNKPTALQLREISRINAAGGLASVIHEDTVEHVRKVVELAKEKDANQWLAAHIEGGTEAAHQFGELIRKKDAHIAELEAKLAEAGKDAARYRCLRDPKTNVALVLDKVVGHTPYDEHTRTGGYNHYEYRSGDELDKAIDDAVAAKEQ